MHSQSLKLTAIVSLLLMLVAVPLTAVAAPSHKAKCSSTKRTKVHALASSATGPVIQFGQFGGNIRPWDAAINADGTVTTKTIAAGQPKLANTTDTLNGLLKLADSEGFWTMPTTTACSGTLPDIASRYIQISTGTSTRKVSVHGNCVQNFNQLFAVLMASADLHY